MKRTRSDDRESDKRRKIESGICALSSEIQLLILSFLDATTLTRCESLNSHFSILARDNSLWRIIYRRQFPLRRTSRRSLGLLGHDKSERRDIDWKARYRVRRNWSRGHCTVTPSHHATTPASLCAILSGSTLRITHDLRDITLKGFDGATLETRNIEGLEIITIGMMSQSLLSSTPTLQEFKIVDGEVTSRIALGREIEGRVDGRVILQHPFMIIPGIGNGIAIYLITSTPGSLSLSSPIIIPSSEELEMGRIGICREFGYLIGFLRQYIAIWHLPTGSLECRIEAARRGEQIECVTGNAIVTSGRRFDFT